MRWSTRLPHALRDRSGAVAVEFVLVAPLLLGFMTSIMFIGQIVQLDSRLGEAVEQGVRYAELNPGATTADIEAKVEGSLGSLDADDVVVTVGNEIVGSETYTLIQASSTLEVPIYGPKVVSSKSLVPQ